MLSQAGPEREIGDTTTETPEEPTMHTTIAPLTGHLRVIPATRPEADPAAVVVSDTDADLTAGELDSWSNRLARLLLQDGAGPGARIAIAIDSPVEEFVAERAVTKIGAVAVSAGSLSGSGAHRGITTRHARPETGEPIEWLVLDDRTTLRRYLTGSDAPLTIEDLPMLGRTA